MIKSTPGLRWRKARPCNSSSCVEVANDGDQVLLRDSKNPQIAPMVFTRDEWTAFTAGVREGDFDFG
jgi:hypothetical protein